MATIEEVWRTTAGGELFNAITRMNLVDRNGYEPLFSKRKELTKHVIGLLLEAGYVPKGL